MQWFDHSSTAASDDAIVALRMTHPDSAAVDCYWGIVEKQYLDERRVPYMKTNAETEAETKAETNAETDVETKALAYRLYVGLDTFRKYVGTMLDLGLLKIDGFGNIYSERAEKAIKEYQQRAETARQNGKAGGRKPKQKPTAKPSQKPTPEPTQEPPRPNTRQDNTGIGFDKQNLSQVSGVADAGEPAPPECPVCTATMERTGAHRGDVFLHRCPLCGEEAWR